MRHLSVEKILDYIEGRASEASRVELEKHLEAECARCEAAIGEFRQLIGFLNEDSKLEPPADSLQWAIDLFQPVVQSEKPGRIRRIIASLVLDTFDEPALAGVRRVGQAPRQLLFKAGAVDVDVKIETTESDERVSFAGQILSTAARFFDNTPVWLESHGIVRYRTQTNELGEFMFDEVPRETYHLSMELPEGQLTLFCVNRGAL